MTHRGPRTARFVGAASFVGAVSLVCAVSFVGAAASTFGCGAPSAPRAAASSDAGIESPSAAPSGSASSAPPSTVDYLVFVPKHFEAEIAPLVALRHREGHDVLVERVEDVGAAHAHQALELALKDEIAKVAGASPKLHYVLLAGDPQGDGAILPTFHHKLGDWAGAWKGQDYASDRDFATAGPTPLAVGRLPARTSDELAGMVKKIVDYEAAPAGPWQAKINVFAGPIGFGDYDPIVEDIASSMLDENVPAAFDLGVLFASATSPYAVGFDHFGDRMIGDLGAGSLLSVFAGHASETELMGVAYRGKHYRIGTSADFRAIRAEADNPILVILTCESGAFDMERDRSIAEAAITDPHGPIATFGAAAVSSAMVNFGWADTLIESFLIERAPTIGDGILSAQRKLPERGSVLGFLSSLGSDELDAQDGADARLEHLRIFNLFGDPATKPHYPSVATIDAPEHVGPGASFTVQVGGAPKAGTLSITLETSRKELKPGIVGADQLEKMKVDAAFRAMDVNSALANDKVVSRATVDLATGAASIKAPRTPGKYWIKVGGVADGKAYRGARSIVVDAN